MTRRQGIQAVKKMLGKLNSPPVPIDEIAKQLGIRILYAPNNKFSGALLKTKGKYFIGLNSLESSSRQRFSIAHEIAHFLLHSNHDTAFFDEPFEVFLRDDKSSQGIDRREIEANRLGAEILMPRLWVVAEIKELEQFSPEEQIRVLANKFEVSESAMKYRILNLALEDQLVK